MLTFEQVLEEFEGYLKEDTVCEVVSTSRGYTVMLWDDRQEEWYDVECCQTPEVLQRVLMENKVSFENYQKIK